MAEETTFVPTGDSALNGVDPALNGVDPAAFALGALPDTNIVTEADAAWALSDQTYVEPVVEAQSVDGGTVVGEGAPVVEPTVVSGGTKPGGDEEEEL